MREFFKENKLTLARLVPSLGLIAAALVIGSYSAKSSAVVFLLAYALSACIIIIRALGELIKDKRIGEKMLMTVASVAAILIGELFEACLIVILFEIGEMIEDLSITTSRKAVTNLKSIRPSKARLKESGEVVPVERVNVGDIIEVLAGERIPLDGVLIEGVGSVDASAITGESTPVDVRTDSEVLAGCLNLSSVIYIKVIRRAEQSAAQRIIDLSQNAIDKKTKNEKFIRRFANIYTPVVIGVAILVALVPPLFNKFNFGEWIYRACALLAISCPCALIISVPLAYFCAIGNAAKQGILVKSSSVLESLDTINTMAFDKTGTLTKADLHVTKVEGVNGTNKLDVLKYICIAEKKSAHPIAMAVAYEAKKLNIVVEDGENYKEYPGQGVECESVYGHIVAGNRTFVDATVGVNTGTVFVSVNGKYVGYVAIGDELKENSRIAFDRLRKLKVRKKIILSGDKKTKVDLVARTLSAEGAYSQLLPEDKLAALENIIETTPDCKIAYCGDGINDLPTLARADVGIAMGAVGSDAAMEKSDVVIMDDDIGKVPLAIKIARKTKRIVITNIVAVIGVKAALLVLSVIGIVPLCGAVIGDVGLLVLAVLNAMRSGK